MVLSKLETNQRSTWFSDQPTTIKGKIGEILVDDYLRKKGYIPYSPIEGIAHPFDRLVASSDKKVIFIADSKAKAARKYYPDTGINIRSYEEYQFISNKYGIDVFLFFVDEEAARIYGGLLKRLEEPNEIEHNGSILNYPIRDNGIIYFPLSKMNHIADLSQEDCEILSVFTTKNDAYKDGITT